MEQLKTIGRELAMGSQGGFGQSKEFLDLIKSIGEARSKAEEDRIVLSEIETLKRRIVEPDIPKRKMKEYIIRLVYVEMLGHDASFGYIHAVKMTHDDSLLLKRTGYLAVTLFLNEDHDLIILIVNTIQKDLKSDNYLVVCAALNAVCKLINEETIPAVLPQVTELLGHPKEAVRKKAVMALHRFYQKSPSSVHHLISNFRKKLCDNDPGVMGATLCPLLDLITFDVDSYKDLVTSFVSILKQVAERRLPKSYDYHQTPAPFIQIKLLKILALLGCGDKKTSEHMYTIISDVMRKCDSTSNIGNAILYECICCVSSIHPSPKLLESAADAIAKFLKSDSHNLKYLGIDALGRLIKISPEIAEQHQLAVIDCLEDPDDTLKRKTFELLYKMTKSSNVEVIVDRMIDYMISLNDSHYKTEIASRCVELAEQFAPSNQWFIQTMNKVFEHAGDLVNVKVAHNLMRLIAEGFGEDDNSADSLLRSSAVESYLRIMGEPKLPSAFLQVICWVLGEYGTADGKYSAAYITGKICDIAEAHSTDDTVRAYAISALTKIYSFEIAAGRKIDILSECQSFIEELLASHSTDLQQRAYELQAVIGLDARTLENIMPMDGSCEDIEVDKSLSFLNAYVQESLEKGAQPYLPESERSGMSSVSNFRNQEQNGTYAHSLRFEAYELPKPSQPSRASPVSLSSSTELVPVPQSSYHGDVYETVVSKPSASDSGSSEVKLRLDGVQKKWGKPSYSAAPSTSDSSVVKTQSGATQPSQRDVSSLSSKAPVLTDSRKQQVEIDPEKQRLAASLFGGTSKSERKHSSATHKAQKPNSRTADKPHMEKSAPSDSGAVKTTPQPPPPDLLDLGEPTSSSAPPLDPFKQLESLLDLSQSSSAQGSDGVSTTKMADFMSLYGDATSSGQSDGGVINPLSTGTGNTNLMFGFSDASDRNGHGGNTTPQLTSQNSKGPNLRDAIEKDALVRQMGVTPSTQNPNLFSDLLG
nr:AP-4 complex subunit epsilon [Ipomoea batatas]